MTVSLEHRYRPRGSAVELLNSHDKEVLLSGPAGPGKSRVCLFKLFAVSLAVPGAHSLIVRKTATSLASSATKMWEEHIAAEAIAFGTCKYFGGSPRRPPMYMFKNGGTKEKPTWDGGSAVVLGGMDRPTRIGSTEYDLIFAQEAVELTIEDWEWLMGRLRNGKVSYQQIIADTNPSMPTHWLNMRHQEGRLKMLDARHWENPRYFDEVYVSDGEEWVVPDRLEELPPKRVEVVTRLNAAPRTRESLTFWSATDGKARVEYRATPLGADYMENTLGALTGIRRQRLLDGLWVAAEGLIYEEFDPAVHVLPNRLYPKMSKPWDIPEDWTRWWSIDWGQTNPLSLSRWAEDPDGRLFHYRQIYRTKRLVEDHCRDVLLDCTKPVGDYEPDPDVVTARSIRDDVEAGRRRWTEPKPRGVIVDSAGAEERKTFERHAGLSTIPAKKSGASGQPSMKTLGIQAVQARMKIAADGRPRIFWCRDAVVERDQELVDAKLPASGLEEIPGYVWAVGADGKRKEEPVDEHNHHMDEARYLVAFRDLRSRPQIRYF